MVYHLSRQNKENIMLSDYNLMKLTTGHTLFILGALQFVSIFCPVSLVCLFKLDSVDQNSKPVSAFQIYFFHF